MIFLGCSNDRTKKIFYELGSDDEVLSSIIVKA